MKIAIVCDWLITVGGAEKVLKELFQCFPRADLFAVIDQFDEATREALGIPIAETTFIQRLPFVKKLYRYYLPLMPIAIEQLDVSSYDLVISSSHAVAKGIITHSHQLHICYIYSPMRYAWDLQTQYFQQLSPLQKILLPVMRHFLHRLRIWDSSNAERVDHFIAISHYIAKRVKKIYNKSADVIYPPVDTDYFVPGTHKEDFYLTASRLVSYKRVDLIIESFSHFPDKKLVVIGDGPEWAKLKTLAPVNVSLLGYQPTPILKDYLQRAKAFIFAAEEDFGILPLEAQASGTPVIAYGKGGALETIRNITESEPTGIHFYHQTVASLCDTIQQFEKQLDSFSQNQCQKQAAKFSVEQFQYNIKKTVLMLANK